MSSIVPGAAVDPIGDRVVGDRADMAAFALAAGHEGAITKAQTVTHTGAERAEA